MNDQDFASIEGAAGTEELRRAFTAPGGRAPRPEECPEPETLWAAVHGELPPAEARDVVDHTATCGACAEDWRLAVEVDRDDEDNEVIPDFDNKKFKPPLPHPHPRRWARFAPLTAAAAAAIVLLFFFPPRPPHDDKPNLRGPQRVESELEDGQVLKREECILRWREIPGAKYDVKINALTGSLLDSARGLTAARYQVPKPKLDGLPSGTHLEWSVTARPPGEALRRSETFRFSLR
jgi:hypothetical protein